MVWIWTFALSEPAREVGMVADLIKPGGVDNEDECRPLD